MHIVFIVIFYGISVKKSQITPVKDGGLMGFAVSKTAV
jgi:hypothetical protein